MAINYTTMSPQFGAVLRILRKRAAITEHALNAADVTSNSDVANLVVANGFATSVNNEARVLADMKNFSQGSQVDGLRTQYRNYRSRVENLSTGFFGKIAEDIGISAVDRAAGAIQYIYDDTSGVISINERRGVLGAFYRDMAANSKLMTTSVVAVGSLTADNGNSGTLVKTSATSLSHTFPGTLRVEVSSEDVTHPKLKIYLQLTNPLPDGVTVVGGDFLLEPEKSWEDGPTGVTMVLTRSGLAAPTVTDPDAVSTVESVTSPKTGDCDHGIYYLKYTRNLTGTTWTLELFNDGSRTVKRGRTTTDTIVGTVALSITCTDGSVVAFTFDRAAAAGVCAAGTSKSNVQFDIQTPRLGDKWSLPTTNDFAGVFASKIGQNWRITMPTGATTFTEADASSISMS